MAGYRIPPHISRYVRQAGASAYRKIPQHYQVRAQRYAHQANAYNTRANRRAAAMGITAISASGLTYKGVRLTPKARQARGKINPISLGHSPSANLRPTSVKYKTAKIRGARQLGPVPIVPRFPGSGYPILGYKKHASFVNTLRRSGPKKTRRPLTRGEYTAIRSGLTKQADVAYKHRVTFAFRKEFKAGGRQLKAAGYRRSYVQPLNKVVYRSRRIRRDSHGRFAGTY